MSDQAKGVPEHIRYKGGSKTVCTSAVLAAFGIDSCTYHYSGYLKQRLQILNKNGWAARSRNSHIRRGFRALKYKGISKTQTRSVGQVRRILALVNRGNPEANAWGDPQGTRYMIRVEGHALLLGYDGSTLVDTDPRARDRRKVLDIRAVFPMPRENPSYRANPTPFVRFIQAERNLQELVDMGASIDLIATADSMSGYQDIDAASFATFIADGFSSRKNKSGRSSLDAEIESLDDHRSMQKYGVRAQAAFRDLAQHFMRQHPINRPLLVQRYQTFVNFLEDTLDTVYASPSKHFTLFNDILIHIERVYSTLRGRDPYNWNMLSFDRALGDISHTVGTATNSPFTNTLISSVAMIGALSDPEGERTSQIVVDYMKLADSLCNVLNPFPDKRIYCLQDITGLNNITCTRAPGGSIITF